VTHTFTGVVTAVTDGTNGSVDLTGTFLAGQPFRVECTIERATPPFNETPNQSSYAEPVTELTAAMGSLVVVGASTTLASVLNDFPLPAGGGIDRFALIGDGMLATQVGDALLSSIIIDLVDDHATTFATTALPRTFPPITEFETRTVRFTFYDEVTGLFGSVTGTIGEVTTPAAAQTWGAVKARYRH
jgi:hypothetical protein